jgi:hypothetical protein
MNEQWVNSIEHCSYKSNSEDTTTENSGLAKLCQATDANFGDNNTINTGWILTNNNQEETIIVSFQTAVFINEIHIYESLNPSSIVKLEMLESKKSEIIL